MVHGFVKACAATPDVKVADCRYNADNISRIVKEEDARDVKCIVFPELCITGYTCNDLFLQNALLEAARKQLLRLVAESKDYDALVAVGLPFSVSGRLYNVAAVYKGGKLLGLVPKSYIPNYAEFYEARYFAEGRDSTVDVSIEGLEYPVPFGSKLLFQCETMPDFVLGIDICEDLWMPIPPSSYHAMAGATVIANLSASDETTGKDVYRRDLVKSQSARVIGGYIYADAGEGESTTDLIFSAHNMIAENGLVLREGERFRNTCVVAELDLNKLVNERRRMKSYPVSAPNQKDYKVIPFHWKDTNKECDLSRIFDKAPFVPPAKEERDKRCKEILTMQALGLKKRLSHTGSKHVVIGVSGGLDSTLALLVAIRAFDMLGLPRKNVYAITMPCFGTTDRTYRNAVALIKYVGATLREIPIRKAVMQHFKDIGQDEDLYDVTYENAQARMRTLVLMDVANQVKGLVVGTGDLSELALGWATYNGDHMSMYGVNASVPKTLVRYLISYVSETSKEEGFQKVLMNILDTPVSPELLPPKQGMVSQKTEEIIGPYELHDFFLYNILRFGYRPSKIYRMARIAFEGRYEGDALLHWLEVFYRRFFSQQFKRSCLPDGPKVGSVALSPRGDFRMPSDAMVTVWMEDLENMNKQQGGSKKWH